MINFLSNKIFKTDNGWLEKQYLNDEFSDVTLLVENNKLPTHKFVLIAQSSYFRALITGGFEESSQNGIELSVSLVPFKVVLKYFYTGRVSLVGLDAEEIIEVIDLLNQYFDSIDLKMKIATYLEANVTISNVISMYGAAILYSMRSLKETCELLIDGNASTLLEQESFEEAPEQVVCAILERDSFFVEEIKIFNAVQKWIRKNPTVDSKVSFLI